MFRCAVISAIVIVGCVPPTARKPAKTPANAVQNAAQPQPTEDVKAQVGVGIKGRSLDPHEGVLVSPVKALFAVKEKAVFEIQIPQAMGLYQASEGNFPKTHDEFMEKIIASQGIKLPQLPEGHTYVYDPESHELKVRRPAAAGSATPAPNAP